jgi:hypothetical protein
MASLVLPVCHAQPLDLNDVSILFPLPAEEESDSLFRPGTEGASGALLPRSVLEQLPNIALDTRENTYASLRAVAARIDPCFPSEQPPIQCLKQVRLVWQPLMKTGRGAIAIDAALHTFYSLSETEFSSLIAELKALKRSSSVSTLGLALQIHPVLAQEGMKGVYAKKLTALLLKYAGAARLTRATFMQLSGGENVWIFGGIDLAQGAATEMKIPRIDRKRQSFMNNPIVPNYFHNSAIVPGPAGPDTFNTLLRDSRKIGQEQEMQVMEETMSAVRVENPKLHNPNTVDCVSCHMAQPARIYAARRFPWLVLEWRATEFRFTSPYNLANTSADPGNTKVMRAFGYDGVKPAISQRTVNETALAVEVLNQ